MLYNHGEGPYEGLLLVESAYYLFNIKDTINSLLLVGRYINIRGLNFS